MGGQARTELEQAIVELADRQHGKLARRQLLALGTGPKAIDYWVRRGWLRLDFRGVYSLGHRPQSRESRWMAAVLYGGEGAALSRWSAAALGGMRSGAGPRAHVTIPRRRASLPEIAFHYGRLLPDEVTQIHGIPTTTAARTILDLAHVLSSPVLARCIAAAESRRLYDGASLPELLARYPHRAGAPKVRAALGRGLDRSRSDFEAEFLSWLRDRELASGEPNGLVELGDQRIEADYVWRPQGVIAELDTYMTHGSRHAFELDRERDRKAQAAGWRVIRITELSDDLERDLRKLLGASAARSPSRRAAA